jgi:DNA-binding PadR family transcriptional regulator
VRDISILVLVSLSDGPKHGYAIQADINAFADVRLGPGTLYGAIARLEREGAIAAAGDDDRRRPYRLTPYGRSRLAHGRSLFQRVIARATVA